MARRDQRFQNVLRELRRQIDDCFVPGDWLPTKRELASIHNIGPRTIERALKVLSTEGSITVIPSVGSRKAARSIESATVKRDRLSVGLMTRRDAEEWGKYEIYSALQAEAHRRAIEIVPIPNPHLTRQSIDHNRIELTRVPWNSFDVGLMVEAEQTIRLRDPILSKHKVLAVDHDASEYGIDSVVFANAKAGAMAARHLLELGHTRFAVTDEFTDRGYPTDSTNTIRRHGFELAIGEAGATLMPQWRLPIPRRTSISNRHTLVRKTVAAWASMPRDRRPSALFAIDDNTLLDGKLIDELRRHGINVPQDLSIIAVTWGGKFFVGPDPVINGLRLTCIDFDLAALVRRVFDAAIELAEEKRQSGAHPLRPPKLYMAPAVLLPGDSTTQPQ